MYVYIIEGEEISNKGSLDENYISWIEEVCSTREFAENRCIELNSSANLLENSVTYSYEEYKVNEENTIPQPQDRLCNCREISLGVFDSSECNLHGNS